LRRSDGTKDDIARADDIRRDGRGTPMKSAPLPQNEEARIAALESYEILDTPPEAAFDDLVRLASEICGTPIALLSLVDRERQWFKAAVGLDASETPRGLAFCAHALLGDEVLTVPDAQADVRFADNPLVVSDPHVRFYAGAPLRTPDGFKLGTLCVIDRVARELTPMQRGALEILGRQVEAQLELRARMRELARTGARLRATARGERDRAIVERDRFFELSVDPMCIAGTDGYFRRVNTAFERALGYVASDLVSRPYLDLVHPDDVGKTSTEASSLAAGGLPSVRFENRYRAKDGSYRWIAWTSVTVPDEGLIYAIARDVTDKKQLEAQLLHAQKMDAIGRLAGGIAHDFNNVLSVILSYAQMITDGLEPGEPLRADVEEIRLAGLRATELTRQLLAFSRQQVLESKVIDLNETVEGMEKMLRRLLGADVELTLLPTGPCKVKADPGQIEQVLMNLAVNARDAMLAGGKLTIETKNVELDEDYARAHHGVRPGSYVMLAVSDSGVGIDRETMTRIFEPFFTTKEVGKGTGLGLSTVFGIVQQSGGHVWVYSEPGHGTTFRVYLPRVAGDVEHTLLERPSAGSSRGSETVLLVDDDDQVRGVARNILRRNGYVVLEASNAGEALLVCEQHTARIHLLLTDVVMPRMSGRVMAERLRAERPEMKVLFMSGYTDAAVTQHGVLESDEPYLQKPITPDKLTSKVRQVLDTYPSPANLKLTRRTS
jgi:PAS domain S-box-containing protein